MWESAITWFGLVLLVVSLTLAVRPVARLGVRTRRRAFALAGTGAAAALVGLVLPASESRASPPRTALDHFASAWQFHEVHERAIAAPPAKVYDAIRLVRAEDIALFRLLTWIRRGGSPLPPGILNAGVDAPLLDVAVRGGFVLLAEDAPRELVIGARVLAPPGTPDPLTPERYTRPWPPGVALATMGFLVQADGRGGSVVTTETRVWASSAGARRRFAAYWRVIYPGSAFIRRMWLRAIAARALRPDAR